MTLQITEDASGAIFSVHIVPRSSVNRVSGTHDEAVKIHLMAPPVNGAANKALIRFLAKRFGVRPYQVEILSGHRSRAKRLRVTGLSAEKIRARLFC